MDENINIFSKRLKKLRTNYNITQKELAEKVEVSSNTIISYEKAQKAPSLDVAKKIALFFNVSLDWMCGITDNTEVEMSSTCDNAIRELIKLDSLLSLEIKSICICDDVGYPQEVFNGYVALIPNSTIIKFLSDWLKMKDLLQDGSIDKDLYDLWLEKQLTDKKGLLLERDVVVRREDCIKDLWLP